MTIDYAPTRDALAHAIAGTKSGVVIRPYGSSTRRYNLDDELADARAVQTSLNAAADAYSALQSSWAESYEMAFRILDRRARFVLSLTTTAPDPIASGIDDASHAALIARADAAAASAAPAPARADLAIYRAAFDTSWSARPVDVDASAEGVALVAALARARAYIDLLLWSRTNP